MADGSRGSSMATSELDPINQPYDDRDGLVWLDGEMVPWRDAKIHFLSHSLHYGGAVFEGQRAYSGKIFKLKEHSQRLLESTRLIDIHTELELEEIKEASLRVLEASGLQDAYIRPIIWRGAEDMGLGALKVKSHFAVAYWEWPFFIDPQKLETGARLNFAEWKRPSPETIPCKSKAAGLYMICTMSKDRATRLGYDDAMMLDYKGDVAEATGANIFFVSNGGLITPPTDCILEGITRQTVIDLAVELGIPVDVRRIAPQELENFEQCFLTGTAAEVMPVGEIGPHKFEVGEMVRTLRAAYLDLVNGRSG